MKTSLYAKRWAFRDPAIGRPVGRMLAGLTGKRLKAANDAVQRVKESKKGGTLVSLIARYEKAITEAVAAVREKDSDTGPVHE